MLSRAEMRVRLEHVLRGIVIVVLAVMLWQSLHGRSDASGRSINARGLGGHALVDWSATPKASERIHVHLDSAPSKVERAWLGALAGAGSGVTWSGDLAPTMIDAQPIASPAGGTMVFIAAPSGSTVMMGDEVGVIDSVRTQQGGASIALNSVAGALSARAKGSLASTTPRDSLLLHRILVIGDAGWESKFVVAALEEEGWKVDAFIRVAPGVDVTQNFAAVIDTTRYSAVIALDGAASPYANRIIDFARSGGGVVLGSQAAVLDAMTPLRAGPVGRTISTSGPFQSGGTVGLAVLPIAPIVSLRSDAVSLEKREGNVVIAATRVGAGRVLQVGYEDTWRWRMGGSDESKRDHRAWWTRLVSRVANAPAIPRVSALANPGNIATADDAAPLTGLVSAVGHAMPPGSSAVGTSGQSSRMILLFLALALCLLGEIGSRRLRGADL